jgi:hypothetical protein
VANALFDKPQDNFEGIGDWQVLWILLSVQVMYFQFLKRVNK